MELETKAWQVEKTNNNKVLYQMQIDQIAGKRARNKILKFVKDWQLVGDGYTPNTKTFLLILSREFNSVKDWIKWAKQFPYEVQELNRNDKVKAIYN